jgi:hypothetical protein
MRARIPVSAEAAPLDAAIIKIVHCCLTDDFPKEVLADFAGRVYSRAGKKERRGFKGKGL